MPNGCQALVEACRSCEDEICGTLTSTGATIGMRKVRSGEALFEKEPGDARQPVGTRQGERNSIQGHAVCFAVVQCCAELCGK